MRLGFVPALLVAVALSGCALAGSPAESPRPSPDSSGTPSPSPAQSPAVVPSPPVGESPSPRQPPGPTAEPQPEPTASPTPGADPEPAADPRWRFFTDDQTRYASPWYDGRHRIMIGFGCTPAPYYRPDPRCRGGQGFHHGIDIAIPCGATLRSAVEGRIVTGGLGPAYGEKAFRIRTADHDLLVAHAQAVLVGDGDHVAPGQAIAEVGALGAPDGCHLHLEQRSVGGGVSSATDPAGVLALER